MDAIGRLTAATSVGSMGLGAGGTAGALLAVDITGNEAAAGLPIGLLVAGSALGALAISAISVRAGRALGLVAGYGLGAVGAIVVIIAAAAQNFAAVLAGSLVLGTANVAVFLARYAAADVSVPAMRARSLGVVLFGASAGAVTSPILLGPSERLAATLGLPRYTGLYLVAIVAFAAAAALTARLRHPTGRRSTGLRSGVAVAPRASDALRSAMTSRRTGVALGILAITNLVMVAIMAIAPVHLSGHGHDHDAVGLIVAAHVLCMFAPAPLTGWLADRFGPHRVALLGAVTLAMAGMTGAAADAHSVLAVVVSLALLGLGWNAGIVAGSAILATAAPRQGRTWAEGLGELAMGTAAAVGAPAAGGIAATGGFAALSIAGACLAVLAIAVLSNVGGWGRAGHRAEVAAAVRRGGA